MNTPLEFIILYDDPAAAARALRAQALLQRDLCSELPARRSLWRTDLLEIPEWRALSLANAASADFVILSTSRDAGALPAVDRWIKECRQKRGALDLTLVALCGSDDACTITITNRQSTYRAGRARAPAPMATHPV